MFTLKNYQQRAVETLAFFLGQCKKGETVEDAYQSTLKSQKMPALIYRDHNFNQIPYVCFRVPTGGGKTILGSYAVEVTANTYLDSDFPIVVWLVPTNTIRLQTVEALKTADHPYRINLDKAFKHQVLVLDIDEVYQIRPHDIGNKTIVVVSTLATLRVNDTSGRNVYKYHENFEPHFAKIPKNHPALGLLERVSEADLKENGLNTNEIGNIKYSFANLLNIYKPLLIVDEAHNARTSLTFETLQRINPSVILEFTATPNTSQTNGSNVIFHVSASELKAEEMIKLPIMLTEHQNWQDAIQDAVLTRNKLEVCAQKDEDYIRPIALFQAEAKNGTVTVDVLKDHLINTMKIDESKIAVATGNQRELDNINLFDQKCPIEYIITIEALKEGWDCSFAYVFCSVKQVSSSKDAEQLLGRVLRMPYAKRRVIEDLNRAYAHLSTNKFSRAAQDLTDKLISMGFEEMEIASFLREKPAMEWQPDLFGTVQETPPPEYNKTLTFELTTFPDITSLSADEKSHIKMTQVDNVTTIQISGSISEDTQNILLDSATKKNQKEQIKRDIRIHNESIESTKAPSERGKVFGSLPQLCLFTQGELELVEPELFLHTNNWNLLDHLAELPRFSIQEKTNSFSIDIDEQQINYKLADQNSIVDFNSGYFDITEQDLICWLDQKTKQLDVPQGQMMKFVTKIVNRLLQQPNMSLTALVRNKFQLAQAIKDLINTYRRRTQKQGYQLSLFGHDSEACHNQSFEYTFTPTHYPSRPPYYSGRYKFQNHYFPSSLIEDLKSQGEEFDCAMMIDSLPQIQYWIRNLVKREQASFWLPLAHNKFYPDFICQLVDGRMLVVEYKGDAYITNDDSAEKRNIGELWARKSNGKCLFVMLAKQDANGRDIKQQLLSIIN